MVWVYVFPLYLPPEVGHEHRRCSALNLVTATSLGDEITRNYVDGHCLISSVMLIFVFVNVEGPLFLWWAT